MKPNRLFSQATNPSDTDNSFAGPAWDTSTEYPSVTSPEFQNELRQFERLVKQMDPLAARLIPLLEKASALTAQSLAEISLIKEITELEERIEIIGSNLDTFVECDLSVDGTLSEQRRLQSQIEKLASEAKAAMAPLSQILLMAPDAFIDALVSDETMKPHAFSIRSSRWFSPHLLSLAEETLLLRLALNGPTAFGNMYTSIASTLECHVATPDGTKTLGIANATGLLQDQNPATRKASYDAIIAAWKSQREACSSVVNALAGWRLDMCEQRSQKRALSFLDSPLHGSRISKETLDTMLATVEENLAIGRRAVTLRARALGLSKLGPWDLFAPAPALSGVEEGRRTFASGLNLVRNAFTEIDPAMGEFVTMMEQSRWIEGRVGNTKRPGAYCTGFQKSRTPRVYMTYRGSNDDIGTLAHELGHAFHSWVMRDLPLAETNYPMTLAETASTFAETVVGENLAANCSTDAERISALWGDVCNAEALLLNLPARFRFEEAFYTERKQRSFTPDDLCAAMRSAWERFYGDTLLDANEYFWASKLHFHISSLSFYNFPYVFGYLFAMGIYAQRAVLGSHFYPSYVALLRDTGRMTAEDVAMKHLGVDLTKPDFWNASLKIASAKLDQFEHVLGTLPSIAPFR